MKNLPVRCPHYIGDKCEIEYLEKKFSQEAQEGSFQPKLDYKGNFCGDAVKWGECEGYKEYIRRNTL